MTIQRISVDVSGAQANDRSHFPVTSADGRFVAFHSDATNLVPDDTNRLCRTFALHLETLNKHRGKGQQKVTVEHVHVHQGGQAIVDAVNAGTGVLPTSEEQAHAIAHSPEPELRRALTPNREPMQVTSDEER